MITTPTVFVLGAGASAPYGYPLGGELTGRIQDLTTPGHPKTSGGGLWQLLVEDYGETRTPREFYEALKDSDPRSIDDFLESNGQFLEIGKLGIAAALTVYGPQPDHGVPPDLHWYRYLWHLMHAEAATSEQFRGNQVKVVTYNYDTSFERYFRTRLAGMYSDLTRGAANEQFVNEVLPVIHLHGSLGSHDSTVRAEAERARFNNLTFYREAASGIRIVHEDEGTTEYATAHAWLRDAKVVCFLGFGYHPTNIRRLKLKQHVEAGARWTFIGGTCFGLREAERQRALGLFALGLRSPEFPFADAQAFLRELFAF